MHSYAQTNIQLFNQLTQSRYSTSDCESISDAYRLVIELFTGGFRASGKTFIAHLVGTASILCKLQVSMQLVTAGLLHAAYASGDFGDGKLGISDAKRKKIRAVVGSEVEEYIAKYTALEWTEYSIPTILEQISTLEAIDQQVLLIRLANELEEYLDLGILYCGDDKYQRYINHNGEMIILIAERLGSPELAAELKQAFKETTSSNVSYRLKNQNSQSASTLVLPSSYRNKFIRIACRLVHKLNLHSIN